MDSQVILRFLSLRCELKHRILQNNRKTTRNLTHYPEVVVYDEHLHAFPLCSLSFASHFGQLTSLECFLLPLVFLIQQILLEPALAGNTYVKHTMFDDLKAVLVDIDSAHYPPNVFSVFLK